MPRYERHIFVCENKREPNHPRGCCYDKGGSELKEKLKSRLNELNLAPTIRVNTSGCLDSCEYGATIVIYPEQVWYGNVNIADVEEIIQSHLINGKVVERLLIKDSRFE